MVDLFSHWFLCSETFLFPIRVASGYQDGRTAQCVEHWGVLLLSPTCVWSSVTLAERSAKMIVMFITCSYVISIYFLSNSWSQGCWSLSQVSQGKRQGTPSTGCQSVTGLTHKDRQPFTLIPTDNSNHQSAKPHACLWIVGGSWNESTQRKGSRLDSNPGSFHCEVTLLTTVARLLLPQVFTHMYKTNTSLCDFHFPLPLLFFLLQKFLPMVHVCDRFHTLICF